MKGVRKLRFSRSNIKGVAKNRNNSQSIHSVRRVHDSLAQLNSKYKCGSSNPRSFRSNVKGMVKKHNKFEYKLRVYMGFDKPMIFLGVVKFLKML